MRYLWQTPHTLANAKLTALIGPEPHTPLPQAVAAALADLGLLTSASGLDASASSAPSAPSAASAAR